MSFGIDAIVASPDGKRFAIGSSWNATLFDLGTGQELRKCEHTGGVCALAFSPNGHLLASGSAGGQIILTDLNADEHADSRRIFGHDTGIHSLSFSADGRTLASESDGGNVVLWDVCPPAPQFLGQPTERIAAAAFADEFTILAGTRGGQLQVWDVRSGTMSAAFPVGAAVTRIAATPGSPILCVGDASGGVSFWEFLDPGPCAKALPLPMPDLSEASASLVTDA